MTNYKQLCAELVDAYAWCVDKYMSADSHDDSLLQRARNALAEPEQEGPTRRQLMILADDMGMESIGDAAEYARAVLARWGNSQHLYRAWP